MVEKLDDPSQELAITGEILKLDAKNYHAWAHRQWVLKSFQLWSSELEFASSLLQEDISKFRSPLFTRIHFSDLKNILIGNNSAWNHRFFILSNFKGFSLEVVNTEIDYTTDLILKAPNNLSPWNYLSGLLSETGFDHSISQKILHFTEVLSPPNEHSIALLIEIHEKCIDLQDLSKSQSVKFLLLSLCT